MLYLDYAKPLADGKYILNFFADSVADLESISHGQKFVTKNGTDYGVPQPGSTVVVTSPNSGKTTYVMDAEGIWVVTEDISYSAVVANPSDEATAKLEKLKVNDTTYAAGGGKYYKHSITVNLSGSDMHFYNLDKTAYSPTGVSQGDFKFEIINQSAAKLSYDEIISILNKNTIAQFNASGRYIYTGVGIIYSYSLAGVGNIAGQMPIACESSDEGLFYLYVNTETTNITDTVTEL